MPAPLLSLGLLKRTHHFDMASGLIHAVTCDVVHDHPILIGEVHAELSPVGLSIGWG